MRQAKQGKEIELEGPFKVAHRHIEGFGAASTRIVDQNGDFAELIEGRFDDGFAMLLVSYVAFEPDGLAASLPYRGCNSFSAFAFKVGYDNRSTSLGEGSGDGPSDTCRRSGDDCNSIIQVERALIGHIFSPEGFAIRRNADRCAGGNYI